MTKKVVIGQVKAAHGLKGQFKIQTYTEEPNNFFTYGAVYIGDQDKGVTLNKHKSITNGFLVSCESINVIYDDKIITTQDILKIFWECHDPTQGMRQGNDIGDQYRSVIYCINDKQLELANKSKELFEKILINQGYEGITTEIDINQSSYPAEKYHQQYLAKNPDGYCGIKGTGCALPPL